MPVELPVKAEPIIIKKAAFDKMQKYKEEYLYLCQIILITRGYIKMAPF